MYHALLLLVLAHLRRLQSNLVFSMILAGVVLFSGSIYLLNTQHLLSLDISGILGPVTPIGGLLLIGSWFVLLVKSLRSA
jgi:uncharacterized membrane protein YgdD (TMEM256/DUF423 family)